MTEIRSFPARLTTFVALLAALVLLVPGCANPDGAETHARAATVDGDPAAPARAVEGEIAPDFTLRGIDGETVKLTDSTGRVRLIDFWATWCAPCREEIPMFNELQQTYGDQGFEILAISDADESAEVVQAFMDEHGVRYTNLLGSEQVSAQYGVYGLPTAFLVDAEGRVVEHYFGPKPRKILERQIRELLELPPLS